MMQGNWFTTDVFLIPLVNYDMVLGVQWLQALDDIMWNYKKLTMKFKVAGTVLELKGVAAHSVSLCSASKMSKLLSQENSTASAHISSLQGMHSTLFQHETQVSQPSHDLALEALLQKYADVFEVPTSLPPARDCDHKIALKYEIFF
jgi:hypothetical protein